MFSIKDLSLLTFLFHSSECKGLLGVNEPHSQVVRSEAPQGCSSEIRVRMPPSLSAEFDLNASWVGPPEGWLYGNWKITWSSNPLYQPFWNPEFDNSPYFPQPSNGSRVTNDLASWNAQCENDTSIYSIFLHDTERSPESFVFDTQATGDFSEQRNTWELMAWGYDTEGVGYIFLYEDAPTTGGLANLCFEVRKRGHPTLETRTALLETTMNLKNAELDELVDGMKALRHDEQRADLAPFPCDAACQSNLYTVHGMNKTAEEVERCPRQ